LFGGVIAAQGLVAALKLCVHTLALVPQLSDQLGVHFAPGCGDPHSKCSQL
jgi:hypothetical protein